MTLQASRLPRAAVILTIAAWLAIGAAGAYHYLDRYVVYRGFPIPTTPAGIPRGVVRDVTFRSAAVGETSHYSVYLPPGYGNGKRYPVLYLLHGFPGKSSVFLNAGAVQVVANILIAHHRLPPVILVMPAGHEGILHGDTEWANTPSGRWEDFVVDVVHDVDSRFATLADRQHRGIAGDSEGAYGAANITLHHPGLFSVMESWSGYFVQEPTGPFTNATAAALRANSPAQYLPSVANKLRRLPVRAWLYQGAADSHSASGLRAFGAQLAKTGADVHVGFFPGGHDWGLWRAQMPRMLTAAGRWFSERPSSAARLQSSGHSLPASVIRRLKARRHHYCLTHVHACRLFHFQHPGLRTPRS